LLVFPLDIIFETVSHSQFDLAIVGCDAINGCVTQCRHDGSHLLGLVHCPTSLRLAAWFAAWLAANFGLTLAGQILHWTRFDFGIRSPLA
jgi:hypothetical protein